MYGQHHAANKTCTVMQNSHSQGECKQITGQETSKINATNRELTESRKQLNSQQESVQLKPNRVQNEVPRSAA